MAHLALSPKFYGAPETMQVGHQAVGLFVLAGSWSADNKTGGLIIGQIVPMLVGRPGRRLAKKLVDAYLWDQDGSDYRMVPSKLWRFVQTDYRTPIAQSLRAAVMERDGYRCVDCGTTADLSLDHIYPWSLGGTDDEDNLRVLCRPCNSRKGARVLAVGQPK